MSEAHHLLCSYLCMSGAYPAAELLLAANSCLYYCTHL